MADVVVIGAGIVGLATAREILRREPALDVVVLEKEDRVAAHQSGRNSGVIHAGLYYRPGSRKARWCRRGVELLLRFCEEHDVPHEICGKVVVATRPEEVPRLEELARRGEANGVPGLELVDSARLRDFEPYARGVRALLSPSTGITDFAAVARALARDVEDRGGEVRFGAGVRGVSESRGRIYLETSSEAVDAGRVVACAGLQADRVARLAGPARLVDDEGRDAGEAPDVRIAPFRGEYWALNEDALHLVRNLIYPVPDPAFPFLGVHFTRRIDGAVEAGPNAVPALAREGYRRRDVRPSDLGDTVGWGPYRRFVRRHWRTGAGEMARSLSRELLARALRRLVPDLVAADLEPAGAGVRAQALAPDGTLVDDFLVTRRERFVSVVNAPSPAATASLAIAERIADIVLAEGGR